MAASQRDMYGIGIYDNMEPLQLIVLSATLPYKSPLSCHGQPTTITQTLLQRGADVNIVVFKDKTALIVAALAENHEAAQTLIEAEADPYINFNLSALMAASQRDMYGNCQTLLQYGADVDATDEDGITALNVCVYEWSQLLCMEYGAQVNLSDINGNTSLMVSNSVAISNMLINAGADVNLYFLSLTG